MTLLYYKPFCFSYANDAALMLIRRNLHKKSSEVSIKTRSPPASLSFKGPATKHTSVKWSIIICTCQSSGLFCWVQNVFTKLSTKDEGPAKIFSIKMLTCAFLICKKSHAVNNVVHTNKFYELPLTPMSKPQSQISYTRGFREQD